MSGQTMICNTLHDEQDFVPATPNHDDLEIHRNPPQPAETCLYGLVGDVARAGSAETETNPYAIAANFMAYLSCAIGRDPYLPIGNTWHHARLFVLHIGRSGRGRKGDAVALTIRLAQAVQQLKPEFAPQIHRGGLSSREGLVALIHDGYRQGGQNIPAIDDKRLWVIESEFSNILHHGRGKGNTLSAALRDCWDGICLKPATKSNRLYASNPHVCISGAITPHELMALMTSREMTNGLANRFLMIWAERSEILPFPKETPQITIDALALRVMQILEFARTAKHDDFLRMDLTPQAQRRYAQFYLGELNDNSAGNRVTSLMERHAPMLLRMAMLFALTDLQLNIDVEHIEVAMAWIRYTNESARYVFNSASDEVKIVQVRQITERIVEFLKERGQASRREITVECFQRHQTKADIDAALEQLLNMAPPKISIKLIHRPKETPGTPTKIYRLVEAGPAIKEGLC
jgi:putative DNA primase/helicase